VHLTYSLSSLCSSPIPFLSSALQLFSLFPLLLTHYLSSLRLTYSLSSLCSSPFALLPLLITNSLSFLCSSTIPSLPSAPQLFPHIKKFYTKKKFKKQVNGCTKCKT
jgi:hypothetical protein